MENKQIYCLIKFHRGTGKISLSLEGEGSELLCKWASKNTPKTKDIVIFKKETGLVEWYYEGSEKGPMVYFEKLGHINDYCPGLWEAVLAD